MAENLRTIKFQDGIIVPNISDETECSKKLTSACCYYNNDTANIKTYGRLYNYFAVKDNIGSQPMRVYSLRS